VRKLKLTVRSKILGTNRGISDFNKGYQPRTNIVEQGTLVAYPYNIVARWRKHSHSC